MNLINKSKEWLILYHPFFAYLALQIEFIEDSSISKTSIDGITFRYNPKYLQSLDVRECAALIAHGMAHVLLLHPLRSENKEAKRWDAATDYAVNQVLKESNIAIMNDLYDLKYKNLSAEDIYEILDDSDDDENKGNDNNSNGNEGSSDNSGDNLSSGQSDSDSGGSEQQEADNSNVCEVEYPDGTGVSEQEQESKMTQKIMDAAMQAQFCGTQLTDSIKSIINQLKEPKKDWREVLFKFTAELARNDYDWERPDLQYLQRNIYVPTLHSLDIGNVVFAIDSSGSTFYAKALPIFLSELKEAAEQITKELIVIHCDTRVRKVEEVQAGEIDTIVPEGGGGTSFRPVFDYINDNDLNPKALIYFTDGKCYETLTEPDYPVIWAIYDNKAFVPQFGEMIIIDN